MDEVLHYAPFVDRGWTFDEVDAAPVVYLDRMLTYWQVRADIEAEAQRAANPGG